MDILDEYEADIGRKVDKITRLEKRIKELEEEKRDLARRGLEYKDGHTEECKDSALDYKVKTGKAEYLCCCGYHEYIADLEQIVKEGE